MSQEKVREFLEQLQIDFSEGRLEQICARMKLPLVIYTVAGATLLRTQDELETMTGQFLAAVQASNQIFTSVEIISMETPQPGRVRATARSIGNDAEGRSILPALIRYFLIADGDTYLVEMLEYLEAPLPPEEIQRILH